VGEQPLTVYDEEPEDVENVATEVAVMGTHPDRQALMDAEEVAPEQVYTQQPRHRQKQQRRTGPNSQSLSAPSEPTIPSSQPEPNNDPLLKPHPGRTLPRSKPHSFTKQTAAAEVSRQEQAASEASHAQKLKDRQRMHQAVAHARKPDKNGNRRLGREGAVLLEKIKKAGKVSDLMKLMG
jgi:hypothetical protein